MSADNGIYIAQFGKSDFRVIHAMAIENLDYYKTEPEQAYEIVKYFKDAKCFDNPTDALLHARKMEKEILADEFCPILEYGINTLPDYKQPFAFYVEKAKESYLNKED